MVSPWQDKLYEPTIHHDIPSKTSILCHWPFWQKIVNYSPMKTHSSQWWKSWFKFGYYYDSLRNTCFYFMWRSWYKWCAYYSLWSWRRHMGKLTNKYFLLFIHNLLYVIISKCYILTNIIIWNYRCLETRL